MNAFDLTWGAVWIKLQLFGVALVQEKCTMSGLHCILSKEICKVFLQTFITPSV